MANFCRCPLCKEKLYVSAVVFHAATVHDLELDVIFNGSHTGHCIHCGKFGWDHFIDNQEHVDEVFALAILSE